MEIAKIIQSISAKRSIIEQWIPDNKEFSLPSGNSLNAHRTRPSRLGLGAEPSREQKESMRELTPMEKKLKNKLKYKHNVIPVKRNATSAAAESDDDEDDMNKKGSGTKTKKAKTKPSVLDEYIKPKKK